MRKIFGLFILFIHSFNAFSQVGINTTSPDAMLDIRASNQSAPLNTDGILIPRIDAFPTINPTISQAGMMVYLTTVSGGQQPGLYYWDNVTTSWISAVGSGNSWKLDGNTGTTVTNFIGTTDNTALIFKVNNQKAGRIGYSDDLFLGYQSGNVNTGIRNTGLGFQTLYSNTTGTNNTANGFQSLYSNTTGSFNTANGIMSLSVNTTGSGNTANGYYSLYSNTTANNNTANGFESLRNNTTGANNTANGYKSLSSNTTGNYNTANGFFSLLSNTTASNNTAIGYESLRVNTTGSNNTANGYQSLRNNTIGVGNTANGHESLRFHTSGNYNTAEGGLSLYNNTTAGYNTATGYQSLYSNTTGISNTAVGYQSLFTNTTGSTNTAIGYISGNSSNNFNSTISIGYNAVATGSNMARIGNSSTTSIGGYVNWTNISDGRFKENIKENVPGLSFIKLLRPVTYRLNRDKIDTKIGLNKYSRLISRDTYSENITGFIAQEVEKAAKETNFNFSGVDKPKNENDFYGLRYAEFVVPLVKAVQEQQGIIVQELEKNKKLLEKIKTLEQRLKIIEEKIK